VAHLIKAKEAAGTVSSHLFPELDTQLLAVCRQACWLGYALPQTEAGCGLAWDNDAVESVGLSARDAAITSLQQLRMAYYSKL
jgi:hypothetical protein